MWTFPQGTVPENILNGSPDPDAWGEPQVRFDACPGFFNDMAMVLNTSICGTWAGALFPSVDGKPGGSE